MRTPKEQLYIYGSENPKNKNNGKAHICNDSGFVLCGSKTQWGEVTACIEYEKNGDLFVSSFGGANNQIDISYSWKYHKCSKCANKLSKQLTQ